jgi:nucleoside-diphosphate-sugar epimerase
MRIFVTGASGWIGSAVVPELLTAGHQVVGLARSDTSAAALAAAGVEVRRGSLDDLDLLASTAAASDGVVHLAFKHDVAFSGGFDEAAAADRRAVDAIGDAIAGSDRPFAIASGLLGVAPGTVTTEADGHVAAAGGGGGLTGRHATAEATLALADRGVRSCVVRLSPTCHGEGDNGFMAMLVATAQQRGTSGYVGDGDARWPAVHRLDAARLFRLAVESAPAGSTLHGVAEQGVPTRDIATAIGELLDLPVTSVAPEDAMQHFGFLGGPLGLDSPASHELTRRLVGWEPTQVGLLADLAAGHYRTPAA